MASGEAYQRQKARSNVHRLIRALMGLGYDEPSAIEITECLIEDAEKDGLQTKYLWSAMDYVAPIPKDT